MALSKVMTRSLISASSSMKQVKAQHAIKSQMDGKAGVLEAEIKLDSGRGGDVAKKKEELEHINKKATEIGQQEMSQLSELNSNMNEAAKADAEEQKQNERLEKQREKRRAEIREHTEQLQERIAEKNSGNVRIPGEGEEKQITVAGATVKTKSASTYNTSVPHIDERVAPTTPSEVSASVSVNHSLDIKT
ncbi:hypothetical protein [Butyrivibrio proteoclasticus]|uniref:hypothetical protein n=1 Tax=Butyrivibrio proteoclasticus TaxID=43305 RepID=UPI0006860F6C|nr:hypothetical protein [Butyrivibrio proteoclasticus]